MPTCSSDDSPKRSASTLHRKAPTDPRRADAAVTASPPTAKPIALTPMTPMTPVAAAISLGATPLAVDEHHIPRLLRADAPMPVQATDIASAARLHVQRPGRTSR